MTERFLNVILFPGFPAHAAAEAAVLLAQGLAPAGFDPARLAHYQVEIWTEPHGFFLRFWGNP